RARLGPCRHSREYFDAGRVIGKYTADDAPGPGGRPWGDTTIRRLHCATPASAMRSISASWWEQAALRPHWSSDSIITRSWPSRRDLIRYCGPPLSIGRKRTMSKLSVGDRLVRL